MPNYPDTILCWMSFQSDGGDTAGPHPVWLGRHSQPSPSLMGWSPEWQNKPGALDIQRVGFKTFLPLLVGTSGLFEPQFPF